MSYMMVCRVLKIKPRSPLKLLWHSVEFSCCTVSSEHTPTGWSAIITTPDTNTGDNDYAKILSSFDKERGSLMGFFDGFLTFFLTIFATSANTNSDPDPSKLAPTKNLIK